MTRIDRFERASPGPVSVPVAPATNVAVGGIRVPADGNASRLILTTVGVTTSKRLTGAADIRVANALLSKLYKGNHTETAEAEIAYARDSRYELRLVMDQRSGGAVYGVASGWHLGKTGFQIDYLSPIEFPRGGANAQRDIAAGLALMQQMASRHHAQALWVEVDDIMRPNYEAAGFRAFARPHPSDPAGLTMMVLTLTPTSDAKLTSDPVGVWREHITTWYKSNWEDPKSPGARAALNAMHRDADRGELTWFQALP